MLISTVISVPGTISPHLIYSIQLYRNKVSRHHYRSRLGPLFAFAGSCVRVLRRSEHCVGPLAAMEPSRYAERRPRRQQRKACDSCRRRKVRCDISDTPGVPCSECNRSSIPCRYADFNLNPSVTLFAISNQPKDPLQDGLNPGADPQRQLKPTLRV